MMKRRIVSFLFLTGLLWGAAGLLGALEAGDTLPPFSVISGDGKILLQSDLRGKSVFLFYEDRSQMDLNEELKNFLRGMAYNDDHILIVVVADCSNAGLLKRIWENSLVDHSRKTGMTVYGDWNGRAKQAFQAPSDTSTFYLIDAEGIVRYSMEGIVPQREFPKIHGAVQN